MCPGCPSLSFKFSQTVIYPNLDLGVLFGIGFEFIQQRLSIRERERKRESRGFNFQRSDLVQIFFMNVLVFLLVFACRCG